MFSTIHTPDGEDLSPSAKRRKLNNSRSPRQFTAVSEVVDLTIDDSDNERTLGAVMATALSDRSRSKQMKTSPTDFRTVETMEVTSRISRSLPATKASKNSPQRPISQSDCASDATAKSVGGKLIDAFHWIAGSRTPKAKTQSELGLANHEQSTDQGYLTPDASDHVMTGDPSETSVNRHTPEFADTTMDHNNDFDFVRPSKPKDRVAPHDELTRALATTIGDNAQPVPSVESSPEIVLRQHFANLREEREASTRALLQNARASAVAPQPASKAASSVFANLQPLRLRASEFRAKRPSGFTIAVETKQQQPGQKSIRARYVVPRKKAKIVDEHKIPRYHHFVRLQQNMLAPNVTVMNCWPYFGDEHQPEEGEYNNCYSMDIENRPLKLTKLHESQHYFDESQKMLNSLKITWSDVLVFLFKQKQDLLPPGLADPSACVDQDFPAPSSDWQRFVSGLSTSSESLAIAAQFCEQFQLQTGLSSWHVARRSNLVRDHFKQLADIDFGKRECRICLRFDCHLHGELAECETHENLGAGEESDSEMDEATATDIVNPPRVNYRNHVAFPELESPIDKHISRRLDVRKTKQNWSEKSFVKTQDMEPFYPCHHPGLDCNQAKCSCWKKNVMCEKYCSCSNKCDRKFRGCACGMDSSKANKEMMCFKNSDCVCYQSGRECDPDLCGSCGVCDVLDPAQPHVHKTMDGNCRNANIQLGQPKHTLLGDSTVHELGLFAAEKIRQHDFVGEYKGEIVTTEEADRRGAIYVHQRLSYLFFLNQRQEVDSTYFGNKVRFINHSDTNSPTRNVYAVIMLVNTVHRIGLFAEKTINPGDELFFDYGPNFPHNQLGNEKIQKKAPVVRNKKLIKNFVEPKVSTHTIEVPQNSKSRSRSKGVAQVKRAAAGKKAVLNRARTESVLSGASSRRQSTVLESESEDESTFVKPKVSTHNIPKKKLKSRSKTRIPNEVKAASKTARRDTDFSHGSSRRPSTVVDSESDDGSSELSDDESEDMNVSAGDRLAAYNISDVRDEYDYDDGDSNEALRKRKRRSSRQHSERDNKRQRRD